MEVTKHGETPIKSKTVLENMGLAVFYKDKLIGELDGFETVCHLMCNNSFNRSTISVPSPFIENGIVDIALTKEKNTKIDVNLANGSPHIKIKIFLTGNILSMDVGLDYSSVENLKVLSEYVNNYLKEHILNYLYKTSKDFGTDTIGFSKNLLRKYATFSDWENVDWSSIYKDAFFDVEVNINVMNSNLLLKN